VLKMNISAGFSSSAGLKELWSAIVITMNLNYKFG